MIVLIYGLEVRDLEVSVRKLFLWNNTVGQTGPVWDVQTVRITFASEVVPATHTQLQDTEPQVEVGFYK